MISNINRLHVAAAVALLGFVHAPMDEAVRLGVKRRMEAPMEIDAGALHEVGGEPKVWVSVDQLNDLVGEMLGQPDVDTFNSPRAPGPEQNVPARSELQEQDPLETETKKLLGQKRPREKKIVETTDEDDLPIVHLLCHPHALEGLGHHMTRVEPNDKVSEFGDGYHSGIETEEPSPVRSPVTPPGNSPSPVLTLAEQNELDQFAEQDELNRFAEQFDLDELNQLGNQELGNTDIVGPTAAQNTELLLTPEDVKFINEKSILPVGLSMQSKGKGKNNYLALRLTDMRYYWREVRENIAGYIAYYGDYSNPTLKKLMEATNDPSWTQEMEGTNEEIAAQFWSTKPNVSFDAWKDILILNEELVEYYADQFELKAMQQNGRRKRGKRVPGSQ